MNPNLTLNDATSFILEKVPPSYQQMLASNFSVRFPFLPELTRYLTDNSTA